MLITSEKSVRQAAEALEAHYLAAQDFAAANCGAEFAILADFPDSAEKTKPGEAELIELAKKLIDDLNSRFCCRRKAGVPLSAPGTCFQFGGRCLYGQGA